MPQTKPIMWSKMLLMMNMILMLMMAKMMFMNHPVKKKSNQKPDKNKMKW